MWSSISPFPSCRHSRVESEVEAWCSRRALICSVLSCDGPRTAMDDISHRRKSYPVWVSSDLQEERGVTWFFRKAGSAGMWLLASAVVHPMMKLRRGGVNRGQEKGGEGTWKKEVGISAKSELALRKNGQTSDRDVILTKMKPQKKEEIVLFLCFAVFFNGCWLDLDGLNASTFNK